MKNFLIDLCLVGLLLFMINGLFGDYGIQKAVFDKNITQFEEDVKEQKPITTDYGTTNDNEENTLSLVVKQISEVCIKVIETLVGDHLLRLFQRRADRFLHHGPRPEPHHRQVQRQIRTHSEDEPSPL